MKPEVLRLERVSYKEQDVTLLDGLSFQIFAGEILGIVPINAVGLDALIRLLEQNLPLHYGYVYYRENLVNSWKTPAHGYNRVGIIESRSRLVGDLTVADNIFVLRHGFHKEVIQPMVLEKQLRPFLNDLGVHLLASMHADCLTAFERCVVELVKAVVAGDRLVVLRDVSTFVSASELTQLHRILRHYTKRGLSFLYICQHHEEAICFCDRFAMMSGGQLLKSFYPEEMELDIAQVYSRAYLERAIREKREKRHSNCYGAPVVFQLKHVTSGSIRDLNFDVCAGECLVVQDMDNTFIGELIALFSGQREAEGGSILLNGEACVPQKDRRIAVLSEQPTKTMLFPQMSYLENLCFTMDDRLRGFWRKHRVRKSIRQECAALVGDKVFNTPTDELSEIEKYDLIYTRVLLQKPLVAICVMPFSNADSETRAHIWDKLHSLLEKEISVVILTVGLTDTLSLADRVLRVSSSHPMEEYRPDQFRELPLDTPWLALYKKDGTDSS